ncbi:heme peroxidase [Cystobasidium minutum MCA 4210]|uniref:heme peroxidase n=1 Tax=Cystobasidium minutum MCA 4210 TaxID=1397322 RepID=UPI0034CF1156|eukprot:jgi/Rhomi1/209314/estExt_Genemark1.C_2_t30160
MASTVFNLVKAILAQVPGAPDGLRDNQANGATEAFNDAATYASLEVHLPLNGKVVQNPPFQPLKEMAHDVIHQVWNGKALKDAMVALQAILSAGSPTDDRELLMEHLVSRLAQMDPEVQLREKITDVFIKGLWEDLPHPVTSLIGDEYRFRQADGSHNNMFEPSLGAAGRPYARSVPPLHPKMPNPPDAELVFNCLLKRDKFVPHPSGISSMLFANAVIIVHSIFRTKYDDPMVNDASGYLDLSPLYGNNLKEQMTVRGTDKYLGLLHPDTVAESRLFLMPPQVVAYLVLFNRNHNYIADMLFKINEKGKFRDPALRDPEDKESIKHFDWQERELFETARLINHNSLLISLS